MPNAPGIRKRIRQTVAKSAATLHHHLGADALAFDRGTAVEVAHAAAREDPAFMGHVLAADSYRDGGQWQPAEKGYAAALTLHPYQGGYWVQHGHMLKEQELFLEAEISYRTAAAYGAPGHDVLEHFRFVMARQAIEEWRYPVRFYRTGTAASQVPGAPDIDALARLVWHVGGVVAADTADLLRRCASCDELLAAMIADARFERANRDWLSVVRNGEL